MSSTTIPSMTVRSCTWNRAAVRSMSKSLGTVRSGSSPTKDRVVDMPTTINVFQSMSVSFAADAGTPSAPMESILDGRLVGAKLRSDCRCLSRSA